MVSHKNTYSNYLFAFFFFFYNVLPFVANVQLAIFLLCMNYHDISGDVKN